jgi:hypothetical protein
VAQNKKTLNAGFKELPITPVALLDLIEHKGWSAGAAALDAAAAQSTDAAVLDPGSSSAVEPPERCRGAAAMDRREASGNG